MHGEYPQLSSVNLLGGEIINYITTGLIDFIDWTAWVKKFNPFFDNIHILS